MSRRGNTNAVFLDPPAGGALMGIGTESMTPVELADPLFQYICRVNRSARKGQVYAQEQVRSETLAILDDILSRASDDPRLAQAFDLNGEKLLLILKAFADDVIRRGNLPFRSHWRNLAAEDGEPNMDSKFWLLLDQALLRADRDPETKDSLLIYYTCIGLGFTGVHEGDAAFLTEKMLEISARLRGKIVVNVEGKKVCPECYEHVNTDDLIKPPARSLVGIGIALAGMIIVLIVANTMLYIYGKANLTDSVRQVKAPTKAQ